MQDDLSLRLALGHCAGLSLAGSKSTKDLIESTLKLGDIC